MWRGENVMYCRSLGVFVEGVRHVSGFGSGQHVDY